MGREGERRGVEGRVCGGEGRGGVGRGVERERKAIPSHTRCKACHSSTRSQITFHFLSSIQYEYLNYLYIALATACWSDTVYQFKCQTLYISLNELIYQYMHTNVHYIPQRRRFTPAGLPYIQTTCTEPWADRIYNVQAIPMF